MTHIALFALIAGGIIASIYKLNSVTEGKFFSTISLYVAALTLLGNLTIGTTMAIARKKYRTLINGPQAIDIAYGYFDSFRYCPYGFAPLTTWQKRFGFMPTHSAHRFRSWHAG